MANLQIKGLDDDLYARLRETAASENRSISQQVVFLIKSHIANEKRFQNIKTPARVLLELSGGWSDIDALKLIIHMPEFLSHFDISK